MRSLIKAVAALSGRLKSLPDSSASILMYHRVTGDLELELDLPEALFERQIQWLAHTDAVVSLDEALAPTDSKDADHKLRYALTFDDAYEDFFTIAWPLLKKYQLPATLFVPTEFIDDPSSVPISYDVSEISANLKPMTWDQIRRVAEDPLITIGAHTHGHKELVRLSDQAIEADLVYSNERFEQELGFVPKHFAYPRGIWDDRVAELVIQYYRTATIIGGQVAVPGTYSMHRIPRIPVRRSDGWRWFPARAQGRLYGEEALIKFIKKLLGRQVGY